MFLYDKISKYSILENKDKKNIFMKNNINFAFLFFLQSPFLLVWFIIKYFLYYYIIINFIISIFFYLIFPIKHNIRVINKLLFLVKELIRILCRIDQKIIVQENSSLYYYTNDNISEILFAGHINMNYLIYAKINSFYNLLSLKKLIGNKEFLVYFHNKKDFYILEKKIADYIESLQARSFNKNYKIRLKIIICDEIPNDYFFKNNYNKNKQFFVLLPQKNKSTILYSKNNIYNNTI